METRLLARGLPRQGAGDPAPFARGGGLPVAPGRVHELCGPARQTLALAVAGAVSGPVLWVRPAWAAERLYPPGFVPLCDPGRLVLVECRRAEDLLWSAEEGLRSGAVGVVVAELPGPPGLTPVRRLHLAAEAGGTASGAPPFGLLLTPGEGGAPGVESRWSLSPCHGGGMTRWRLERLRARTAPPAQWHLAQGRTGLVPAA